MSDTSVARHEDYAAGDLRGAAYEASRCMAALRLAIVGLANQADEGHEIERLDILALEALAHEAESAVMRAVTHAPEAA